MSHIKKIRQSGFSKLYKATILPRAQKKADLLLALLAPNSRVLEIGSGNCGLAHLLSKAGHKITATDIVECSYFSDIKPIVFNGEQLPFKNTTFDYVLLITMLHHTQNQEQLLREAKRLGRRIIVMEDIYTHKMGKHLTQLTDSLVNFEFKGHPHTNRSNKEWKNLFKNLGLKVSKEKHLRTLCFFRQVVYELEYSMK